MVRDKQLVIKRYIIVSSILLIAEGGIIQFVMIPLLGLSVPIMYHLCNVLLIVGFLLLILYNLYKNTETTKITE